MQDQNLFLPIPRRQRGLESPPSKSTAATPQEDSEEETTKPQKKRSFFAFKLTKKDSASDKKSPGRVLSSLANLVVNRKQSLEEDAPRGRRHSALAQCASVADLPLKLGRSASHDLPHPVSLSPIRELSSARYSCRGVALTPIRADRRPSDWPAPAAAQRSLALFERFVAAERHLTRDVIHAFAHTLGLTLPDRPLAFAEGRYLLGPAAFEDLFVMGPVIGRGQQGEVRACMSKFVAWWIELKKADEELRHVLRRDAALVYAVKIVPKGLWNIKPLTKFLNVIKQNDNTVRSFAIYDDTWNYFILMERLSGPSMLQHLALLEAPTEHQCRDLFAQVMRSLSWIHHVGLIHRDLKPSNFVFRAPRRLPPNKYRDALQQVVLVDWGLCCHASDANWLPPEGSLDYMAPELFLTRRAPFACSAASDVWSAGQLLAFLLTGEPIIAPGGTFHALRRVRPERVFDNDGNLIRPHHYWQVAVVELSKLVGAAPESGFETHDDVFSSLSSSLARRQSSLTRRQSSPVDQQLTLEQSSQVDAQLEAAEGALYGPRVVAFPRTTSDEGQLSAACPEALRAFVDLEEAAKQKLAPGWRMQERTFVVYYLCGFEAAFERAVARAGALSEDAFRLLLKMLTLDPALRPTAEDVARNAHWLQQPEGGQTPISPHVRQMWKVESTTAPQLLLPAHLTDKWTEDASVSSSSRNDDKTADEKTTDDNKSELSENSCEQEATPPRRSRRSSQLFATVANSLKGLWGGDEGKSSARRHSVGVPQSSNSQIVMELAEFLEARKRLLADINQQAAMYEPQTLFVPSPNEAETRRASVMTQSWLCAEADVCLTRTDSIDRRHSLMRADSRPVYPPLYPEPRFTRTDSRLMRTDSRQEQRYMQVEPRADSRLTRTDSRMARGDSRLMRGDSRLARADSRPVYADLYMNSKTDSTPLHGESNPQFTDHNPHYTDSNPHYADSNPQYTDSNPHYGSSNPRYTDPNPRCIDSNPRCTDSNPRCTDSNPRCTDSNPRLTDSVQLYNESNPLYPDSNQLYNESSAAQYSSYLDEDTQTDTQLMLDAGTQTMESFLEKFSKGSQTNFSARKQVDASTSLPLYSGLSLRRNNFDTIHSGRSQTFERGHVRSGVFVPTADPVTNRPRRRSIFASLGMSPTQLSIDVARH